MATIDQIKRHVSLTRITLETLTHLVRTVTDEEARTWRDGDDGWTILEIICHLRDFDVIFRDRAQMMMDEVNPVLPAFDHEAMAVDLRYNEQNLEEALGDLRISRAAFREFFKSRAAADWERLGQHPERARFAMEDALMQVSIHDNVHIEQISRIIANYRPSR